MLCLIGVALGWIFADGAMAGQKARNVERGRKLFNQFCAVCHGVTGKGDGPAAAALKVAPADLTVIQKLRENFPFYRVQTKIEGEKEIIAHGPRRMPIWGTIFRRSKGELEKHSDIYALVRYIQSIQVAGK